jgi:TrmH family RNA methyltransferase
MITSLQNDRVKLVRALQTSGKSRRKENRVVLEGVRLVGDALAAGATVDFVFYTQDITAENHPGWRLLETLQDQNVTCLEVSPEVMAHMADTQTPQGILAVVALPELEIPKSINVALILDGVADPGNMGTILRTAAAAGVDVMFLAPGCVDPFNPKVLRSGMGAHFRLPIVRLNWNDISQRLGEMPMYLADAEGDKRYHEVDWTRPSALIIGGEARGAEMEARQRANAVIFIPMGDAAESLNAAVAAGVILFEMRRQRELPG